MRRRKHNRGEAIHARLEAQLRANLDDPRANRAYAESLHARGDPMGELMLASLRAEEFDRQRGRNWVLEPERWPQPNCRWGRRAGDIIQEHWHEWFGDLEVGDVSLDWRHGLVRRLWLGCYARVPSLRRLLAAPPLAFLESLDAGEQIGHLGRLRHLPNLRELSLPATTALDSPEELAHLRGGLTLTGSARELRLWRDELRRCFPGVKLMPRLPVPAIDADFIGPKANREPRWAGSGPTECARSTEDSRPFRFCAACAGDDTTLLVALPDPAINRVSTTYEYVCHECGWFTWYAILEVEPSFPRPRRARRTPRMRLAS